MAKIVQLEPVIKIIKIIPKDGGTTETIHAEQIGKDTYKLLENPLLNCRLNYGMIIKVVDNGNGDLIMSKLISASDYKTIRLLFSSEDIIKFKEIIGEKILASGGTWETVMGGLAFVSIPRNSNLDLHQLFEENNFFPTEIVDDQERDV